MRQISFDEAMSVYQQGDLDNSVKAFTELAEQGDARAQNQLGNMYGTGEGVKQSYDEDRYWCRRAAEQGLVDSQYRLGLQYWKKHSYEESVKWIRLAADQGFSEAQGQLGAMYRSGQGVVEDMKEAMRWFTMAAEQGNADYQRIVGVTYFREGAYANALKWLQPAADQGEATAQEFLGVMYAKGYGLTHDFKEAAKWFRLSADQGDSDAQLNLGLMYGKGEGVHEDLKEAVKWLGLAAEQNSQTARYHLGLMYAEGRGVVQDSAHAHNLLEMSAQGGCSEAHAYLNSGLLKKSKEFRQSDKPLFINRLKGCVQLSAGIGLWILGISLVVSWLAFCFGTVIVGLLLLFFAPHVLIFPLAVCTVPGNSLIYLGVKNLRYSGNDGQ